MQRKTHSVQIDSAGHERIERVAEHYLLTQAGAAALVVRAATDDQIKAEVKKLADQQVDTMGPVTRTAEVPHQGRPPTKPAQG